MHLVIAMTYLVRLTLSLSHRHRMCPPPLSRHRH